MGEFLSRIQTQVSDLLQSLDSRQRVIYGLIAAALVIVLGLGVFFMTQTNYTTIMTNLSDTDAGAMTAKLDELGIPWKLDNNRTTLMVPDQQGDKALMELAVGGFTSSGDITWQDVMNQTSIVMSNDEKNKLYLQAQATGIARTIEALDSVDDAIMNLQMSPQSNFLIENDDEARASVVLNLKGGAQLTEPQVNGIVMLIVNAVQGLEPDNVTILDTTGVQLNNTKIDSEEYVIGNQMEMTDAVRKDVRSRIKDFLSTIYGNDHVEVSVNVKLDFDSQESEQVVFSPPEGFEEGLVRSMTELSENVIGTSSGGAAGTDSNIDPTTYAEDSSGTSTYRKANRTLNYELNQINTKISKAKGQIEDISIAVIVNKEKLLNEVMTEEQRLEVVGLVSAAAGLDARYIQVSAQEFAPDDSVLISTAEGAGALPIPMWLIGVIAGIVIVILVSVIFVMRRRTSQKQFEEEQAVIEQEELEEITSDFQDKSSPKYQIEKFLEGNPEAVAALLRSWLNED